MIASDIFAIRSRREAGAIRYAIFVICGNDAMK